MKEREVRVPLSHYMRLRCRELELLKAVDRELKAKREERDERRRLQKQVQKLEARLSPVILHGAQAYRD